MDTPSKLASAYLKSETNVTLVGILVKHEAKAGDVAICSQFALPLHCLCAAV